MIQCFARTENTSFSPTNAAEIRSLLTQVCVIKRVVRCIPRTHKTRTFHPLSIICARGNSISHRWPDSDTMHSCKTRCTYVVLCIKVL